MDQIVINGLTKIKKATAWRGDGDIRGRIDDIVNEIKAVQKKLAKKGKEGEYPDDKAEKYWDCYRMGLENKSARVRENTLLALQELIDEAYITGEESAEDESNPEKTIIDDIATCCCACVEIEDDGVYNQLCKTLKSIITSHDTGLHGESLINAIYAFFDSYTYCKSVAASDEIKQSLLDVLTYLYKKLKVKSKKSKSNDESEAKDSEAKKESGKEEMDVPSSKIVTSLESESVYPAVENQLGFKYTGMPVEETTNVGESKNDEPEDPNIDVDQKRIDDLPSLYYKDAFLLLRSLCELATREDEANQPISASKLFALDVLSSLIDNAGPNFDTHPTFIYAIRKYLLPGILNNFVSNNIRLVEVSMTLFVSIIKRFLPHIKKEVEVFISSIFLVILNSPNSSDKQKELILSAFEELLKDPSFIVSIFVNFDCDMSAINVYERIIITLNNVIQGNFVQIEKTPKIELEDEEPPQEQGEEEEEEEEPTIEYTEARAKAVHCMNNIIQPLAKRVHEFIDEEIKRKQKADADAEEDDNEEEKPVSAPSSDIAARFDEKRRLQEEYAMGIAKFNKKPRKGIEYLVSVGRIENTPESVAKFLYDHSEDLNKTTIGDYLGEDKQFNLDVLAAYSGLIDYTGMVFDKSIRAFLARFRLPGEAQKIDRIMERFAGKFYECNPTTFDNADTAFVLGFSVIMLNTDLHNPNIPEEKKMKKEEFVSNNRGINDGKDLPKEVLEGIYDAIMNEPISLKEDDLAREKLALTQGGKNENAEVIRQRAFSLEKNEMMANLKLDVDPTIDSIFTKVSVLDSYILPMYKLLHNHTFTSYTLILQYIEDEDLCKMVLESAHDMFTVSSYYTLNDEKAQCIEAIAGCGFVNEEQWLMVTPIQVEAMRELVNMGSKEYNYIGGGWKYIMKAISSLSQIHMYGLKSYIKYELSLHENVKTWFYDHSSYDLESAKNVEDIVESICDLRTLDTIFLNSDKINNGIIDFVQALCNVSIADIKEGMKKENEDEKDKKKTMKNYEVEEGLDERSIHRPRVYLMQKIVEVADSNMNKRGRYEWTKMWDLISDYLITIGSMNNFEIAFTGIDGLKQLSLKFLDKEEKKNFNFQKIFLRPFDSILSRRPSNEIKDLILHVIHNIILSRSNKLSSGWKALLSALSCCAEDEDDTNTLYAWSIAKSLIDTYLDKVKVDIPDIMNCYVSFIQCENEEIHNEAFSYLYKCAKIVLEDEIPDLKTDIVDVKGQQLKVFDDNKVHISYWWPYFLGLCRFIPKDYRSDIRKSACERLFLVLNDPLIYFTKSFWSLILEGLVLSMFNELIATQVPTINELLSKSDSDSEINENENAIVKKIRSLSVVDGDIKSETTAYYFLTDLVRLFINKYDQLKDLLDVLISFLHKCILQGILDLARIAVQAYSILLIEGGKLFDEATWNKLLDSIHLLYTSTSAEELLNKRKELDILPLEGKVKGDKLDVGTYVKTNLGIGQIIDNKEQYFVVHLASGKAYFQDYSAMEVIIPELLKARKEQQQVQENPVEEEQNEEEEQEEEQEDEEGEEGETEAVPETKDDDEFKLTDTRQLNFDVELTIVHASIQLELSILMKSLIQEHYSHLSMDNINLLLNTLTDTMKVCDLFNQDEDYRTLIHNLGFMNESPNLPLLARQHGICLSVYILILFSLFTDTEHADRVLFAKQQLLERCGKLLTDYINYEKKNLNKTGDAIDNTAQRSARALVPVVNEIFDGFSSCTIESFKQYFLELYSYCVDIIEVGSIETRTHAATFFRTKIGTLLFEKK